MTGPRIEAATSRRALLDTATLDAALAVLTFVIAFAFSYGPEALRMSVPASLVVSAAAAAVVWVSGRRPAIGLGAVVVISIALPLAGVTFSAMDLVVVLVAARAVLDSAISLHACAVACLVSLTVTDVWHRVASGVTFAQPNVLYPAIVTAFVLGLGLQGRRLRRQHAELASLRESDRRRAVFDERRRIARDLHDLTAAHLTALVVRTKVASRLDEPVALREAVGFSARTAGAALESLRDVVRVLSTESDVPLAARIVDTLDDVVAVMTSAGLVVQRSEAHLGQLAADVRSAVVAITREALANVLRHRGPGRAWLNLEADGDSVMVTVEDDGPAIPPRCDGGYTGAGQGIAGMHQRAEACGGRLTVTASPRGGWRVVAALPNRPT